MYKYVLTAALISGSISPALAEKGFYIVRGPDKKCVVVDVAPRRNRNHRDESWQKRLCNARRGRR